MTRFLPADVARCPGVGDWEEGGWEWRDGCEDCLRRTSLGPSDLPPIAPESIIVFECPWRIGPDDPQPINSTPAPDPPPTRPPAA